MNFQKITHCYEEEVATIVSKASSAGFEVEVMDNFIYLSNGVVVHPIEVVGEFFVE